MNNSGYCIIGILSTIFLACKSNTDINESQIIKVANLTLRVPSSFRYMKGKGVDSYVAYIVNSTNDTLLIEYGRPRIIYNLFDGGPVAKLRSEKKAYEEIKGRPTDPELFVYTGTPSDDNAEGVFLENYYRYDTINGLLAKIVQPKKIGHGITGILIAELPDSNAVSVYGRNLDSAAHKEALEVFETVRYVGQNTTH
jgi:hypothetical protein